MVGGRTGQIGLFATPRVERVDTRKGPGHAIIHHHHMVAKTALEYQKKHDHVNRKHFAQVNWKLVYTGEGGIPPH